MNAEAIDGCCAVINLHNFGNASEKNIKTAIDQALEDYNHQFSRNCADCDKETNALVCPNCMTDGVHTETDPLDDEVIPAGMLIAVTTTKQTKAIAALKSRKFKKGPECHNRKSGNNLVLWFLVITNKKR